jgi:putative phage-type endonuclease
MKSFYVIDDLEQGTDAWRNWRKKVIGASDAPTIMGENPWSESDYLLREKLGRVAEFKGNAATREGNALEGEARRKASAYLGIHFDPSIIQDGFHPFLAASLDGVSEDASYILEIKSGVKSYAHTQRTGQPPEYYYAQLQHILMISGLESLYYASYRPHEELIVLEIGRDDPYIEHMLESEIRFVKKLESHGHTMQSSFRGKKAK